MAGRKVSEGDVSLFTLSSFLSLEPGYYITYSKCKYNKNLTQTTQCTLTLEHIYCQRVYERHTEAYRWHARMLSRI